MSQHSSSYAERKLQAISLAAELDGEITVPARQFNKMLEILDMADVALREITNYSTDRGIALAQWRARQCLGEMDKMAETL